MTTEIFPPKFGSFKIRITLFSHSNVIALGAANVYMEIITKIINGYIISISLVITL